MNARAARSCLCSSLIVLGLLAGAPRARGAALESAAGLTRALRSGTRGEAALRYDVPTAAGTLRPVRATLALELPDRARLDIASSGERIVVRTDGGEWLQPATRQLVRFSPRQAAPALRWWSVLLGREPEARERRLGFRRWQVTLPANATQPADTAEIVLDARGLPARLAAGGMAFGLTNWRFHPARGAESFRLAAPVGFETVEMP